MPVKNILFLFSFLIMLSCKHQPVQKHNDLYGNWQFLTADGNYNEAFFSDSTYFSYNHKRGLFPVSHYYLKNDTLFSDANKNKEGMYPIAGFLLLNKDKVIFINQFSRDTLYRLSGDSLLSDFIENKGSMVYEKVFMDRYKAFLLERGIIDE